MASLSVSPSSTTVGVDQSRLFSIVAHSSSGRIVSVSPGWSVSGGIGTVNSNGVFTAGSTTGTGYVIASYNSLSGQATVTITDTCWIQGRVTGERDAAGVPNIKIFLNSGADYYDYTDSSGNYSIANVPAGTYDVYSEETEIYIASSKEATVADGETRTVNFYLTAHAGLPDFPDVPELEL